MMERIKLEEGWLTLFLVWSLIAVTALAILAAELVEGTQVLLGVGTLAILAGLVLAKSNFSARTAHVISLVYGLALIAFLVGRTLPGDPTWRQRVLDLVYRQVTWVNKALEGGTSRDSLIFVLQTSGIFWLLGYTASWYTFRKPRVWRVVLPTGLVLLSVIYYYYGPKPLTLYLGAYALLALLYIARSYLVLQEKEWRRGSVRYESGISFDFLRAGFLVGVVALLLASTLPAIGASASVNNALSGVNQPWRQMQDNWTRLFSSLRSYGSGTNDPYQDTLTLGGPRTVGNETVMDVYVGQRLPSVYWQSVVLDTYNEDDWSNSTERTVLHLPDEGTLDTPFSTGRSVITQTVVNYIPNSGTLYGAPEIVGSDKQLMVDVRYNEQNSMVVNWVRSRYVLRQGDRYNVISRISTADQNSLRQASANYPDWVEDTYLQVPDIITDETIELAEGLTAGHNNAYDKAIAVRDYLRENIAYNDQIQAPPPDAEPIDYTLFVSQEGYCNYYASAMAMMLRTQGVPTRIVTGYAQGEYVEDGSFYRVRASNAHTWVEVYFPGYGWIQFEPTAAIPVVSRPETGEGDTSEAEGAGSDETNLEDRLSQEEEKNEILEDLLQEEGLEGQDTSLLTDDPRANVFRAVGAGLLLTLAAGMVVFANQFNQRVEKDVERSYGRLESWARWLGVFFRPVHTPYERAEMLVQEVPDGRGPIRSLVQEYVVRRFSPGRDEEEEFDPRDEWRVLRPLLIRKSFRRFLQRRRNDDDESGLDMD